MLEFITNTFYRTDENNNISVTLNNQPGMNYYDRKQITLSEVIMEEFKKLGLPQFVVFYHELGHHLFSQGYFTVLEAWSKINTGPLEWNKKYGHLCNWIEDYYIEEQMRINYSYTTDVLSCLTKIPPEYPIGDKEYAFNYFYVHGAVTPALQHTEGMQFLAYVKRLLTLRQDGKTRFGKGVVTNLTIKRKSRETEYVETIIEFYNWCVGVGIFPPDQPLPQLDNPNQHLEKAPGGNQQGNQQGDDQQDGNQGTSLDHSHDVGTTEYIQVPHIKNPTDLFKEELTAEKSMIDKELLDMQQRKDVEKSTLDGLFSAKHHDSTMIQPKVNVPNFFNPNRLVDRNLFKEKEHTYMNVAIYRDISGSTHGYVHTLMEYVTAKLFEDIPVDITYYLYASGNISIVEVPYIPWEYNGDNPYYDNPLVGQMDGGTNSDAIADVITQQLSDKWLNIVITDGDLRALRARDSIEGLLNNIFVISVNAPLADDLKGIYIKDKEDIEQINSTLSTMNMV